MRILFVANYPDQPTGYARIANVLSNFLASLPNTVVYYFGFNNHLDTKLNRFVHPDIQFFDVIQESKNRGSTEVFGKDLIVAYIEEIKPDILFIYNDIIVTCNLFNSLLAIKKKLPYKTITYLDLVYEYEKPEYVRHVDRNSDSILVFSECWKNNLIDMGVSPDKIGILHHGLDTEHFYTVDTLVAREQIRLPPNDFLVLNTNSNTYRKAHDISIRAFLQFLKRRGCPPDIKMMMNCALNTKAGYNIISLIETECMRLSLPFERIINTNFITIKPEGKLDDRTLNLLYNACDIGINTAVGEGFGLCNLEHASVGKPQIVARVGGLKDIFSDENSLLIRPICSLAVANHTDDHGGLIEICKSDDFANAIEKYYSDRVQRITHGNNVQLHVVETYNWDNILKRLQRFITRFSK